MLRFAGRYQGDTNVTQEFYISVTPVRDSGYLVRTERVASGVPLAEEQIDASDWPVERWLEQAAHLMHEPLVGLLRGSRTGATLPVTGSPASDLVSLGQELYGALFQGTIRDSWMIAQGVAQSQKQALRLRLGLKGDTLPRLPWEVLHDGARPLATGADVAFSRYHSALAAIPSSAAKQSDFDADPLRILMVLAAPTDQEVLQLQQEAEHLKSELQQGHNSSKNAVTLTILEQPGREELTQALEQGRYDILHYAGHSNLGMSGGDLYLVSDRTGLTEVLSGDDLAGLLANNGVHMAVFNSCRGVQAANAGDRVNEIGSLADALLKRGVPAVLAMAERIPDDVALNLSRLFYRNLKQRLPVDLSLNRARQGLLSSYGSDQLYWALPILYLHPEFDGFLQKVLPQSGLSAQDANLLGLTEDEAFLAGDLDRYDDLLEGPGLPGDDLDLAGDDDRAAVLDLFRELSGNGSNGSNGATNGATNGAANGRTSPPTLETESEDFLSLGKKLQAQGDLTASIAAYGDAIKLNPQSAQAYNQLGTALQQYGSLPEALTAYKMAARLDPSLQSAQSNLQSLLQGDPNPDLQTPASAVLAPTPEAQSHRQPSQTTSKSSPAESPVLKTVLTLGAAASVLTSLWWVSATGGKRPNTAPPAITATANNTTDPQADPQMLVNKALAGVKEKDLKKATDAIETLLNQNLVTQAQGVMSTVPVDQQNTPIMQYLMGRMNLQFAKLKDRSGSAGDAWRSFQGAVRSQPDSVPYHNAFAFALYEDRQWEEAGKAWLGTMELVNKQEGKNAANHPEMLMAQAGQALVLQQMAKTDSKNSKRLLGKAISFRDAVLAQKADAFNSVTLAKDWRWNEDAIADWTKLQTLKN
jgi:tetratricopeptide (TPR) repeat protein